MKKSFVFSTAIIGLLYTYDSLGMCQSLKKRHSFFTRMIPKKRNLFVHIQPKNTYIKELEKSNQNILEMLLKNKEKASSCVLSEHELYLHRIQRFYAKKIIAYNNTFNSKRIIHR